MSKFDKKAERHKIITTINGVENYINARSQNEFELALVVLHDKVQKYGIQRMFVEVMTIRNSDGRVMRRDCWIETPQRMVS